jgi:branched-chain amino acid transport system substrate-binding protein
MPKTAAFAGVATTGGPVSRDAVRDAIQSANIETLQGPLSFDENGDIKDRVVSIFQYRKDATKPLDDFTAQCKYIGAAPQV